MMIWIKDHGGFFILNEAVIGGDYCYLKNEWSSGLSYS